MLILLRARHGRFFSVSARDQSYWHSMLVIIHNIGPIVHQEIRKGNLPRPDHGGLLFYSPQMHDVSTASIST